MNLRRTDRQRGDAEAPGIDKGLHVAGLLIGAAVPVVSSLGGPSDSLVAGAGPVLVQLCGMRLQLNGPNDVGVVGRWPQGVIVSFNHSSGRVLPWTTMRWKFGTS